MIMTFVSAQIVSKYPGFKQLEIQTRTGRRRYGAALGTMGENNGGKNVKQTTVSLCNLRMNDCKCING